MPDGTPEGGPKPCGVLYHPLGVHVESQPSIVVVINTVVVPIVPFVHELGAGAVSKGGKMTGGKIIPVECTGLVPVGCGCGCAGRFVDSIGRVPVLWGDKEPIRGGAVLPNEYEGEDPVGANGVVSAVPAPVVGKLGRAKW